MATIDVSASEALTASGVHDAGRTLPASSSDSMRLADSFLGGFEILASYSDLMIAGSGIAGSRLVDASESEALVAADAFSVGQILTAMLREGIQVVASLTFKGQQFDGFVLNANTFAATRYSGFNFNSFCQYQGRYYGCASDGIHELAGGDDAGTPIDALLHTGNIRPFANSMARVPDAYLMIRNDGKMKVRVVHHGQIYSYDVESTSDFHKEARVKLGKGAKSVLWQFVVANEDGSDFDIESFKIYPIELTRHIG